MSIENDDEMTLGREYSRESLELDNIENDQFLEHDKQVLENISKNIEIDDKLPEFLSTQEGIQRLQELAGFKSPKRLPVEKKVEKKNDWSYSTKLLNRIIEIMTAFQIRGISNDLALSSALEVYKMEQFKNGG